MWKGEAEGAQIQASKVFEYLAHECAQPRASCYGSLREVYDSSAQEKLQAQEKLRIT